MNAQYLARACKHHQMVAIVNVQGVPHNYAICAVSTAHIRGARAEQWAESPDLTRNFYSACASFRHLV